MTLIMNSLVYGNGWVTPKFRAVFEDEKTTLDVFNIMSVLATTQAEFNLIPESAALGIRAGIDQVVVDHVFLDKVRLGYELTNHSLLGLINVVSAQCPSNSGEWLCYGATVQDITDTRTILILQEFQSHYLDQINQIRAILTSLSSQYRDTLMSGRTHGQSGLPITFGYKTAVWLDEFNRHYQRLIEIHPRISMGQLCGGVGSLSPFGPDALNLQQQFFHKLGLNKPHISWTSSRDRYAEWLQVLTLIASTCDRIGKEIYNLQRPEINELSEGQQVGQIGSITMPQKNNPEISEHLGTLSRIVRYASSQMNEALIHDHERDGRAWKTEWVVLPDGCLATEKCLALTAKVLSSLKVNENMMKQNLMVTKGAIFAEAIMLAITPKTGKQSAHRLVNQVAVQAQNDQIDFKQAVINNKELSTLLTVSKINSIFNLDQLTSKCGEMVDQVISQQVYFEVRGQDDLTCKDD